MLTSNVTICNLALAHLGSDASITSISPADGSIEAGLCARYFDLTRRYLLRQHTWSFATARASLVLNGVNTTQWSYSYAKPALCTAVRRVTSSTDETPTEFRVEGDSILSNVPDAMVVYSFDQTDVGKFPEAFVLALSYRLAQYLAGSIIRGVDSIKIADALGNTALVTLSDAIVNDSNESSTTDTIIPSVIVARE